MHLGDFYGHADVSGTIVQGTSSSLEVLPPSNIRTRVVMQSDSVTAWYVKLGPSASTADFTYKIPSGSRHVLNAPMHTGSISAVQAVAGGKMIVTQFTAVSPRKS